MIGTIRNWAKFQHYKDRSPPWIKLHHELLDDFDFCRLPIASRALAPMLWLLASESEGGTVNIDPAYLAFRLRCPVKEVEAGLKPLCDAGFVIVASTPLAPCLHDACLETEGETETEGEGETPPPLKIAGKKSKTPIPGDFALSNRVKSWAIEKGFTRLPEHFDSFVSKVAANGYTYVDWDAALMNAIRDDWAKLRTDRNGKPAEPIRKRVPL